MLTAPFELMSPSLKDTTFPGDIDCNCTTKPTNYTRSVSVPQEFKHLEPSKKALLSK